MAPKYARKKPEKDTGMTILALRSMPPPRANRRFHDGAFLRSEENEMVGYVNHDWE